jgi:phenylpyruvate tautomerase PptA (4-oxalocrotonate tautomerase family)
MRASHCGNRTVTAVFVNDRAERDWVWQQKDAAGIKQQRVEAFGHA